jgi:succinate dehydrogenase / fumarate reductase cytochrome b subunit
MRALQRYRIHTGTAAFILHRLAGLGLILYLLTHVWVIHSLIKGKESFDRTMEFFNTPIFKFFEIGLVGIIFYHLFNGLRLTVIDIGPMSEKQSHKVLFGVAVVLWLVTWGVVGWAMLTKVGGLLNAVAQSGGGSAS